MNILICGKNSAFCRQLLRRLGKEKNELYYLTGNEKELKLDIPVFQTYRFSYLDKNIVRAVTSSKADVLIMLGALDLNFTWETGKKTAADYTSSVLRVLTAAKNSDVSKVIYISTIEVFENNSGTSLTRSTEPLCSSLRAKTLKKVEQLCMDFSDEIMQIEIVRLPQVFGNYESVQENNICLATALDYVRSGKMTCFPDSWHMAMYDDDAAEIICRIVKDNEWGSLTDEVINKDKKGYDEEIIVEETKHLYQFKGYLFSEQALCETILKTGHVKDAEVNSMPAESMEYETSCLFKFLEDTQESEIGFSQRYGFSEAIDILCRNLLKYRKKEEKNKKESLKILPIIETVFFSVLAFILSYAAKDTWVGDNFNFFVVLVVFISAVYGIAHGLLASLLGSVGTLVLMLIDSSVTDVFNGFEFFLRFLLLVMVGIIAGFMRDKFFRRNKNLMEENTYLAEELANITRINDSNLYIKNTYEKRLIEYQNSLARVYELTSQLDSMATQEVIFKAVRMVQEMMNTQDIAIYISSRQSEYYRLAAVGTEKAKALGKSIQITKGHFLYDSVSQHEVYMNRELVMDRPTFTGAVYDGDIPIAMVMVWAENIEQVNLYESNMLAILCKLIDNALERALSYEEALKDKTHVENSIILKEDSFKAIVNIYENGMKQGLMTYALLELEPENNEPALIEGLVRNTDYIGIVGGRLFICLSNSNKDEAELVRTRIENKGFKNSVVSYEDLCRAYEVNVFHEQ